MSKLNFQIFKLISTQYSIFRFHPRTICTNPFHLLRRPRRPETCIKDGWKEMELISVWIIRPERQDYFFKSAPLLPEIFRWYNQKVVFHLLSNRIFRKLFLIVNSQPFLVSSHNKTKKVCEGDSGVSWRIFLCKRFLLSKYVCIAPCRVSEKAL